MSRLTELRTALLDILHETGDMHLHIIVGGGYGIYLKREFVRSSGVETLLKEVPEARATNDLDLFLRPELLIEPEQLRPLANAIGHLGYRVVPSAAKYQFVREAQGTGIIKIDLLTGPKASFRGTDVKVDDRRARPPKSKSVGIHAHPVDEAPTLENGLRKLVISGQLSTGSEFQGKVAVPHPFTYLMMKLYAFRDRLHDQEKDLGGYHVLDLYTIMATTIEEEWNQATAMANEYSDTPQFREARRIVSEHFGKPASLGVLRLKESKYFESRFEVDEFLSALHELFHFSDIR